MTDDKLPHITPERMAEIREEARLKVEAELAEIERAVRTRPRHWWMAWRRRKPQWRRPTGRIEIHRGGQGEGA